MVGWRLDYYIQGVQTLMSHSMEGKQNRRDSVQTYKGVKSKKGMLPGDISEFDPIRRSRRLLESVEGFLRGRIRTGSLRTEQCSGLGCLGHLSGARQTGSRSIQDFCISRFRNANGVRVVCPFIPPGRFTQHFYAGCSLIWLSQGHSLDETFPTLEKAMRN